MSDLERLRAENARLRAEVAALREDLILSEEDEIATRDVSRMEALIGELYEAAFEVCRICEYEGYGN